MAKKGVVLGANLLTAAASLVFTGIAIRGAGAANYGAFVVIGSIVTFLYGVAPLGLDFPFKRRFAIDYGRPANRWETFAPQFVCEMAIAGGMAAICFLFADKIGALFHLGAFPAWSIPGYLLCYVLFGQCTDYFRYSLRIFTSVSLSVLFVWVQIALAASWWKLTGQLTLPGLFGTLLVALALTVLPTGVIIYRELNPRGWPISLHRLRTDFGIGYPVTLSFVLDHLLNSSGRYLLASMVSIAAVAHYNAALLIANLALLIPRASTTVLQPLMSQYFDSGRPEVARLLLLWTTRLYIAFAVPFVVGACVLGKIVLTAFATAEVASQADYVLPLLAAGFACSGLTVLWSNALFVRLDMQAQMRINAWSAGLIVVLTCLGLAFWRSATVPAAACALCYALAGGLMFRQIDSEWHVRRVGDVLVRSLVAAAAMATAVWAIKPMLVELKIGLALTALITIGVAVYAGVGALLGLPARLKQSQGENLFNPALASEAVQSGRP